MFSFACQANENKGHDSINQQKATKDPTIIKLNDITNNISLRKKEVDAKLQLLEKAQTDQEKEKIQSMVDTIQLTISDQETSFEMILTAGIELDEDETIAKKDFDWQKDLIEILQPFLRELHKLTENKQKLDNLHYRIAFHQLQIRKINEALKHISNINNENLQDEALFEFERISKKWQDQLEESKHLFEVAQLQRDEMIQFQTSQETSFVDYVREFAEGRGATFLLALTAFIGVYFIMHLFMKFFSWLINRGEERRSYYQRVVTLLYHLLMGTLAITAFFYVLEVRNDPVMTGITIVLLISIVWVLKNSIPTYIDELRLLLNTGSAREGECIVYNGIPMQIESVHYYTKLKNPFLPHLKLRLTLSELAKYVSRPISSDEPWFPCKVGDYVMLYGDIYGMVKYITLENIVLSLPDGTMPITYTIEDFFIANPRNFSSGFIATTAFGIDSKHLGISTIEIPRIMTEGIQQGLSKESYGKALKDLSVHFAKTDSSLLEYEIIASFDGAAASEFYSIMRALQRYAVEICNQRQWMLVAE
ncbi:MAG: hypothetical protein H0X02_01265 [Nitrosomonas sp.]|nr:hypothetical protein [Nitrosomonas sp.]